MRTLLMAEAVVFGRSAMGEAVEQGAFTDRWRVRRDGRLVFAETVRLDGAIARMLAEPAVAGGGVAIATVLAVPGDAGDGRTGARANFLWRGRRSRPGTGLRSARLCAKDGASLRRDLATVMTALGGTLPRLWLN